MLSQASFITPVVKSPGLFFDQLLDVKFSNNNWNVVTYVEIDHIQPHLNDVEFLLHKVETYCKSLLSTKIYNDCSNSLTSLQSQHSNNLKKFSSISYLIQKREKRVKRGLIDAGGSLLKTFFGTLDADDAIKFSDAINQVQTDEKRLAHLMKDNIHVIKSTISTFNSTISKVDANQNIINKNLDNIEITLNQLSSINNNLDVRSQFNSLLNSIESIITTLSFDIDDINNAILFSKLNVLHPSVLSPYQLYNDLEQHMNNLPKHFELPIPLSLQNIHDLVDVSKIVCYYHNNKIILILRIPLVLPQTYNLYHAIPLPVPYDISKPDTYVMIAPSKSYLAITVDRMFYSTFDNLDKCKLISEKCYVCELNNVYSTIANPTCETILLSEVINSLPSVCETKLLKGSVDLFHRLSKSRWVFVQSEPGKCHITCENDENTYDEILLGTGILALRKDCKAFFKTLQFSGSNSYELNITTHISSFNIILDDCCEKTKINQTLHHLPIVKLTNTNDLDSLLHASIHLRDFEEELRKLENPTHLERYSFHYLSLTYVISIIVLVYILYRSRKLLTPKDCTPYCLQIFNQCNTKKDKRVVTKMTNRCRTSIEEIPPSSSEEEPNIVPIPVKRNIL